jgi:hypothetical protein
MSTVWVLVALVNSGHGWHSVVPTMEFGTQQRCEAAIVVFENETQSKLGTAKMRCVRIEK